MYRKFREALVLFVIALGIPAMTSAHEICRTKIPPRESAVSENHGFFFFVYPRTLDAAYSGCQTMWDEKGNPLFVLTFEKGSLTKYELNDPSGVSEKQTCVYKLGKGVQHNAKDCPDYDDLKDGFRSLPNRDEPIVPPERDPRR